LQYLKDHKDKAQKMLEELANQDVHIDNIEDALDKAKALHEVGLTQLSKSWFDRISQFCQQQQTDPYLQSYLQQERAERAELTTAPRELNNIAVMHFQHGNWQAAQAAFSHAFRLLPKNTGIALNLLQSVLMAPQNSPQPEKQALIQSCLQVIEKGKLNSEQSRRFEQLKQKHLAPQ
jgi:tetratricopeptide (TPR) repeat protein